MNTHGRLHVHWPLPHPNRRESGKPAPHGRTATSFLTGAVIVLLAAIVGLVTALLLPPLAPSGIPHLSVPAGTIVSVRTAGSGQLIVRTPKGAVDLLTMTGYQLRAADGSSLTLKDVRNGDAVAFRPGGVIADTDQARTTVEGVVVMAPDADGDALAVQVSGGRSVLVDLESGTRINGSPNTSLARLAILDASQVRVTGILNTRLDEMTRAQSIDRIGPAVHPGGPAGDAPLLGR